MNSSDGPHAPELSLAAKGRIDRLCLAFEDAWRAGRRPSVERSLGEAAEPERGPLLRELVLLDCYYRFQAGESPVVAEYQARFPEHREMIAEVLAEDNLPWRQISLDETTASEAAEHRNVAAAAAAQFLPGTMLAGRYRIVAPLGRGGMGEVYRADDLKLGQSVALKFLPPQLAHDATCLEYLRREVRLARQVAHPNVCRVYDLGEAEGRQFLSMEYVDGEDLAGLLRRIGHLPTDKGLIVAQQIFAGLAAAHREGIVHRDLKPSNIMLDSRGHVRITDFGLACLADAAEREARWAGTPLYMAPEQLAQQPVTPRSDLYAAGLLVYELLTGQRPFAGTTPEELRRSREQTQPRCPSLLVDGVDPTVENVILQCLTADPHERPASALSVVARLPHADPLEAVLAAGETPPPELVAAACDPAALSPLRAVACLAAVLVGLVAVVFLSASTTLVGQAHPKEPAVLAERARDVIREQGYEDATRDEAFGFAYSGADGGRASIHFWYRQSPARLVPTLYAGSLESPGTGSVSWDDPPTPVPGEAAVRLTPSGRLIEFRAAPVPGSLDTSERPDQQAAGQDAAWRARLAELMRQAELVGERDGAAAGQPWVSVPSAWTAPVSCDQRETWETVCPDTGRPLRIAAAHCAGQCVYFRVAPAETQREPEGRSAISLAGLDAAMVVLTFSLLAAAAVLARANLRRGRADRKGARRLVTFVFCLSLAAWLLLTSRAGRLPHWSVFVMGLQYALLWAGALGLFYVALEPSVRRLWPAALVSWSRVLAGRLRDPRVASDVLVGAAGGVTTQLLWQLTLRLPSWCGLGPSYVFGFERTAFAAPLQTLLGGRYCLGEFLQRQTYALAIGLSILLLLLLLRLLLRRQWLAAAAYVLIGVVLWPVGVGDPILSRITSGMTSLLVAVLATRYGLVTLVSYTFVRFLLLFPMTTQLTAWHATGTTLFPIAAIVALAVYGVHVARAKRPLVRSAVVS